MVRNERNSDPHPVLVSGPPSSQDGGGSADPGFENLLS